MDELEEGRLLEAVKQIKEALVSNDRKMDEHYQRLEKKMDDYVTQKEFVPVRQVVYMIVGLITTGFLGALLAMVFRQPPKG